jgi:hypothetical protein
MKFSIFAISLAVMSPLDVVGFTTAPSHKTMLKADSTALNVGKEGNDSRRDFMSKSLATAVTAATTGGMGVLAPQPANAVKGADKVNAQLKA